MPLEFRYFRAPETEMIGLLSGVRTCSLCGQSGRCFSLESRVVSRELTEEQRQGKIGCVDCLKRDRFGFSHDTVVGCITNAGLETFGEVEDESPHLFLVSSDGDAALSDTPLTPLPKPRVPAEAVAELRRTPRFATWQDFMWPVHHDDFMAYLEHPDAPSIIIFECLHCEKRAEIDDPD